MRRALILDDQMTRHRWFAGELSLRGYERVHVTTAQGAIGMLGNDHNQGGYDLICLDHDLGDVENGSGMEVAEWMRTHTGWGTNPCTVLVHSLNFPAAKLMVDKLREHGAVHVPFYDLHSGKAKLK